VEANDAFLKSHGLDKSAIGRLHASAWNAQLEGDALQQRIQSIRDAGGIKAFEATHCRSDGSVFDVEINANVFHFDGVSYLFNSARDITERAAAAGARAAGGGTHRGARHGTRRSRIRQRGEDPLHDERQP
jgi:PAS domain S-box-containing protein